MYWLFERDEIYKNKYIFALFLLNFILTIILYYCIENEYLKKKNKKLLTRLIYN